LNHLLDHELDLSNLDERYRNDETGAPAYPPVVLLKVILSAYSRGVVGGRPMERVCREHVIFVVKCGRYYESGESIAD
jgi:transposase